MCPKVICSRSILNRHSVNILIDISVNTRSTSYLTVSWESTNFRGQCHQVLIDSYESVDTTNNRSSVDWVLIKMSIECKFNVDWVSIKMSFKMLIKWRSISQHYSSPWMPWEHMINTNDNYWELKFSMLSCCVAWKSHAIPLQRNIFVEGFAMFGLEASDRLVWVKNF